jgi:predicted nucleic acid-binding Zn finger protein
MDKSVIFKNYNYLKKVIQSLNTDRFRLNRALGVAQLKIPRPYSTSLHSCTCPDFIYRHVICKHILALWLKQNTDYVQKLILERKLK